jgi:cell division protein FtsB
MKYKIFIFLRMEENTTQPISTDASKPVISKTSEPKNEKMSNRNIVLIIFASVFLTLLFAGSFFYFLYQKNQEELESENERITQEYKNTKSDIQKLNDEMEKMKNDEYSDNEDDEEMENEMGDDDEEEEKAKPQAEDIINTPSEDTFTIDQWGGYAGKLLVKGYATTESVEEAWCEANCETYTYVFFNIVSTDNDYIQDYINDSQGNAFVGENSIGIGCVEDGQIFRASVSRDNPEMPDDYKNSTEASEIILNSSAASPVTIEIDKYNSLMAMGAPTCWSHFSDLRVVE